MTLVVRNMLCDIKHYGVKPTFRLPENMALPEGICDPNGRRALCLEPRRNPRRPIIEGCQPAGERSADEDSDPAYDDCGDKPLEDTISCCTGTYVTSTFSWKGGFYPDDPASSSKDVR